MPKAKYKPDKKIKFIDQATMAKLVATHLSLPASVIIEVIELEQKLTMQYVRDGYKVTKKNYISFTPVKRPAYSMNSKLTGEVYNIPERLTIRSRLGQGFKVFVSNGGHKMPNKICRFVDNKKKTQMELPA